MDDDAVDFALMAWREDGRWQVAALPPRAADSLDQLLHAVRQQPSDAGSIGLVSVADDFFLAVRVQGEHVRLLLSDVTAGHDWPLARDVLDHLGIPAPDADDLDAVQPAGDVMIFADLGLDPAEVDVLCNDLDLYPDEVLGSVAARLGFGEQYDAVLESLPG